MTTTDHTYIRNIPEGRLIYCTHCHGAQIVPLPAPLAEWSAAVERFARQHRHCQPQTAAATAPGRTQQGATPMNDDTPEGKIECLEVLGTPYVLLSDYRRMQIRAADNLAAAEAEAARYRARSADLAAENESLRARLTAAETDLADFVTEAVEQNCGVPNSHGIRIFSHSFVATYEGWIEFLVQRGEMRRLDEDRELYVFVADLPPSEEAPAP